jgi:uncharacterized protein YjiS (DUF1127 family)
MSAPITKSQLAFQLPNLSYVDASLEEANLRIAAPPAKPRGLSALIAAFRAWNQERVDMRELEMLTDRELADIGLNRADVHRVFRAGQNQDLLERAA